MARELGLRDGSGKESTNATTSWESWAADDRRNHSSRQARPPGPSSSRIGSHRRAGAFWRSPRLELGTANVLTAQTALRREELARRFEDSGLDLVGGAGV